MEGYRLLSDKRMWKIGTKGRYGFLVSVVTTMFDFVLSAIYMPYIILVTSVSLAKRWYGYL